MDENHQDEITINNINPNHNMDIISQSTKKENILTNNIDNNGSIMNFNPNISRSIEYNIEEDMKDKCLDINLVSNYKLFIF